MKPTIFNLLIICMFCFGSNASAQLFIAAGENFHTKSGETLYVDGLTLYPTVDFILTDNELNRNSSAIHAFSTTYVQRVFRFNNNTAAFTGTIEVNYLEAELNTLPEAELKTAVYNGTNWQLINSTTNSADNNYVLSNSVSTVLLNEITLARSLSTLPLQWLTYSIQKKENNAEINWSTTMEQDTKDFLVGHSIDGSNWEIIGTVLAKGQLTENKYSFTHYSPEVGRHFYRLLQRDITGRSFYSNVLSLVFGSRESAIIVYPNPVSNGSFNLQLSKAGQVTMYNSVGITIFQKELPDGVTRIQVNQLVKGTYYLRAENEIVMVVIQ